MINIKLDIRGRLVSIDGLRPSDDLQILHHGLYNKSDNNPVSSIYIGQDINVIQITYEDDGSIKGIFPGKGSDRVKVTFG